jgi:RyR domain
MPIDLDYELIAEQIHEFYRAKFGGMPPYAQLPEFMKADNREAALRIGQVLSMAGLRIEPCSGTAWTADDQQRIRDIIEDHLELLAEAEHRGWMEARVRHGWVKADQVDREKKESHLLVPFSEFTRAITRKQEIAGPAIHKSDPRKGKPMSVPEEVEAEKDKDRDSVRNYVDFIAKTKYRIVEEG